MDLTLLSRIRRIVTHKNCPDGMASAIILHDALPEAEILFVAPGSPEHRVVSADHEVPTLYCDIAPHGELVVDEFARRTTVVLDHHKTAREIVKAFGDNGVFADEKEQPGVSGALLAYEVWCLTAASRLDAAVRNRVHNFATLAGIRDTWQRSSPRWREACEQAAALIFYPPSSWRMEGPFHLDLRLGGPSAVFQTQLDLGKILVEKHEADVAQAIKDGFRFTAREIVRDPRAVRVIVFQGTTLTSDAAEKLGNSVDLVIGFRYASGEGGLCNLHLSTRSHTGFDCAKFAAFLGGGGHTAAAGATVHFSAADTGHGNPYATIAQIVGRFLGTP